VRGCRGGGSAVGSCDFWDGVVDVGGRRGEWDVWSTDTCCAIIDGGRVVWSE